MLAPVMNESTPCIMAPKRVQLWHAAGTLKRYLWSFLTAQKVLLDPSNPSFLSRKSTCDACSWKHPTGRCCECGCFLESKQRLAFEACPVGKWLAIKL